MDEMYMKRCFELARRGFRTTGNNPMVGAVLVHDNRIIGEGYHQVYGGPHAEVNCFDSVKLENRAHISNATLYVSLEPCSYHGKTPACSALIINHKPARVVVAVMDPNPQVAGRGIEALRQKGIRVETGILETEGEELIHKFRINMFNQRPYIALKWAQSAYGYAGLPDKSIWFTNELSRVIAHQLRGTYEAIMIGANTIILDDPLLDNRLGLGQSPIKIVIDPSGRVPLNSKVCTQGETCYIISQSEIPKETTSLIKWITIPKQEWNWSNIFSKIHDEGITSVLVEGGPTLQTTIIKEGLWDEAHVLSTKHTLHHGIRAPKAEGRRLESIPLGTDMYSRIRKEES